MVHLEVGEFEAVDDGCSGGEEVRDGDAGAQGEEDGGEVAEYILYPRPRGVHRGRRGRDRVSRVVWVVLVGWWEGDGVGNWWPWLWQNAPCCYRKLIVGAFIKVWSS